MIYNDKYKTIDFFFKPQTSIRVELILYYLFVYIIHIQMVLLWYNLFVIRWGIWLSHHEQAVYRYVTALFAAILTAMRSICLQIIIISILSHFVLVVDVLRSLGLRELNRPATIFGRNLEAKNGEQSTTN